MGKTYISFVFLISLNVNLFDIIYRDVLLYWTMSCMYIRICIWLDRIQRLLAKLYSILDMYYCCCCRCWYVYMYEIIIVVVRRRRNSIDRLFLIHMLYCYWLHMFLFKNEQMLFFHMDDIVILWHVLLPLRISSFLPSSSSSSPLCLVLLVMTDRKKLRVDSFHVVRKKDDYVFIYVGDVIGEDFADEILAFNWI